MIHLKTDSRFLYEYTLAVCKENNLEILAATADLYASTPEGSVSGKLTLPGTEPSGFAGPAHTGEIRPEVREVKTYYETMFSRQGYKITYLCFRLPSAPAAAAAMADASVMPDQIGHLRSPASFDADYWRSVEGPRHSVSLPDFEM